MSARAKTQNTIVRVRVRLRLSGAVTLSRSLSVDYVSVRMARGIHRNNGMVVTSQGATGSIKGIIRGITNRATGLIADMGGSVMT